MVPASPIPAQIRDNDLESHFDQSSLALEQTHNRSPPSFTNHSTCTGHSRSPTLNRGATNQSTNCQPPDPPSRGVNLAVDQPQFNPQLQAPSYFTTHLPAPSPLGAPSASTGAASSRKTHQPINPNYPINPSVPSSSAQPPYPSPSPPVTTSTRPSQNPPPSPLKRRWSLRKALPQIPSHRLIRLQLEAQRTARLWNPSNSTPRSRRSNAPGPNLTGYTTQFTQRARSRREPSIPLSHPQLYQNDDGSFEYIDLEAKGGKIGKGTERGIPLLSLKEQRNSKQGLGSSRPSLQVELSGSGRNSVAGRRSPLPRGLSQDQSRRNSQLGLEPVISAEASEDSRQRKDKGKGRAEDIESPYIMADVEKSNRGPLDGMSAALGFSNPPGTATSPSHPTDALPSNPHHESTSRYGHQQQHSIASSVDSSIAYSIPHSQHSGEIQWGPSHPCFPHPNPHVPRDSPLYKTTNVIRIPRDYMASGDLYPQFSTLYPELLGEAGLGQEEFTNSINQLNAILAEVFMPFGVSGAMKKGGVEVQPNNAGRNLLDGVLGLLTGWIWEDTGLVGIKSGVARAEKYLEVFNTQLEQQGKEARWMSLKGTAYLSLDIQIPAPQIGIVEAESEVGRMVTGATAPLSPQLGGDGSGEYEERKYTEM